MHIFWQMHVNWLKKGKQCQVHVEVEWPGTEAEQEARAETRELEPTRAERTGLEPTRVERTGLEPTRAEQTEQKSTSAEETLAFENAF